MNKRQRKKFSKLWNLRKTHRPREGDFAKARYWLGFKLRPIPTMKAVVVITKDQLDEIQEGIEKWNID